MSNQTERLNTALADRYRIDRELGAGGMATVYLAHDFKHDRDVAIKVLHPDLGAALGGERFLSEIRTTARLQHPHILPLLDSGDADGLLYYVMPLVTGETLRARLDREQQLPIDDAVRIAREVASALDYAHRQNIIHRDIKPENILLHDGQAIVADFGIALAVQSAGGARMTQTGLSLGTPQYMSPEQAMGEKTMDARSDVYALGAVTYEMLAGEPPFSGASVQAIVARILSERPTALHTLRDTVPEPIERAVLQALAKLPADRFASARAFSDALSPASVALNEAARAANMRPGSKRRSGSFAYAVAVLGVLAGIAGWRQSARRAESAEAARFTIPLRDSLPLALGGTERLQWGRPSSPAIAMSPDGQTIVVAAMRVDANGPTQSRLYRRRVDDERLQAIPGTDSASGPFFSPSGREIGFFVGRSLRSVSLTGDSARRIADNIEGNAVFTNTGTWGANGTIVYTTSLGLWEVPGAGGVPRRIPVVDDSAAGAVFLPVRAPQLLRGDARVLFHAYRTRDPQRAVLRLLDRSSGTVTTVLENAMHGTVVGDTLLLFMRSGALMAAHFNATTGTVTGEPVTVEEGIAQAIAMPNSVLESGVGQYAVSARGDMVIARGGLYPLRPRVVLIRAPDGRVRRLALPERQYGFVRSSPTGDRLLLQITGLAQRGGTSIALFEMARYVMTMINTSGYINDRPIWNRDGRRFVYESDAASDGRNLFVASVDAGAPPERITTSPRIQRPAEWLPDGTIVNLQTGAGGDALWLRSPDGTMRSWLDASTPDLKFPALSPDGRRMAYVMSNQVFVRPFPGPGSAVAVSGVGASEPAWAPNGDQLYFVSQSTSARERQNVESSATALPSTSMVPSTSMPPSTSTLMAVEVSRDEPLRVGRPRAVMTAFPAFTGSTPIRGAWDVMPNGSLVMIVPADTSAQADFNRAAIHEIHVAQRALRGLRWGAAPSTPKR